MTRTLPFLLLFCASVSNAQPLLPVPPITRSVTVSPRQITNRLTFNWTPSPNATTHQYWFTTNENVFNENDTGFASSNVTLAFNHHRRVWFVVMAMNGNGVGWGDYLIAHYPKYTLIPTGMNILSQDDETFFVQSSVDLNSWTRFGTATNGLMHVPTDEPARFFKSDRFITAIQTFRKDERDK